MFCLEFGPRSVDPHNRMDVHNLALVLTPNLKEFKLQTVSGGVCCAERSWSRCPIESSDGETRLGYPGIGHQELHFTLIQDLR